MFNNPMKIMFLVMLITGTLISTSSNSWLSIWMGLEINLLSFIPLMSNTKNVLSTEASLKYFLTQVIASAMLLFSIILMSMNTQFSMLAGHLTDFANITIMSSLLLKAGGAPFHFWLPGVMEGLNWLNCLILMTWQKIAPMMLMSYCMKTSLFTSSVIMLSVLIGSIGGLNQTSLRKLLAYSSINHLGWMMAAMIYGENLWMFYFMVYSFLNMSITLMLSSSQVFHFNQIYLMNNETPLAKFAIFSTLLSLGGLPPFLGFLPKWIIIQYMSMNSMAPIIIVMVTTTLLTLFYYLQMAYSAFLITHSETKWNKISTFKPLHHNMAVISAAVSLTGLMLCTILLNMA